MRPTVVPCSIWEPEVKKNGCPIAAWLSRFDFFLLTFLPPHTHFFFFLLPITVISIDPTVYLEIVCHHGGFLSISSFTPRSVCSQETDPLRTSVPTVSVEFFFKNDSIRSVQSLSETWPQSQHQSRLVRHHVVHHGYPSATMASTTFPSAATGSTSQPDRQRQAQSARGLCAIPACTDFSPASQASGRACHRSTDYDS